MADKETLDVYNAKAAEYAGIVGEGHGPDTLLRAFLDALPARAYIWDLGCGPGRSAELMAAEGHTVLATDASPKMVALAQARPGVTARQATFDEITGASDFDGIFANFSLLHADGPDLPRYVKAVAQALKPGAVFHIGMKVGNGTQRDGLGRRYTYVTKDSLTTLLEQVGLFPIAQWQGEGAGLDGVVAPWIVMQARKDG